jgi:hypothetical protein
VSAVISEQNTNTALVAQETHGYKSGEYNIYIFTADTLSANSSHTKQKICFSSARYTSVKWECYKISTHSGELLLTHTTQQEHYHSLWFSACPRYWIWTVSMMSACYFVSNIFTTGTVFRHKKKPFPLAERKLFMYKRRSVHYIYSQQRHRFIIHTTKLHQDKPHFCSACPSWWF